MVKVQAGFGDLEAGEFPRLVLQQMLVPHSGGRCHALEAISWTEANTSMLHTPNAPSNINDRLDLTALSLDIWRTDAEYLASAGDASQITGFVDGHNLVRAGEMLDEIEHELRVLDKLRTGSSGASVTRIDSLSGELRELAHGLRVTSRALHRLT